MHIDTVPLVAKIVLNQLAVCEDNLRLAHSALQACNLNTGAGQLDAGPSDLSLRYQQYDERMYRLVLQVKSARSHLRALEADLIETRNLIEEQ